MVFTFKNPRISEHYSTWFGISSKMVWCQHSVKPSGWKMPLSRVLSWENPCLFLTQASLGSPHLPNQHWGQILYKKCTWAQHIQACHIRHLSQKLELDTEPGWLSSPGMWYLKGWLRAQVALGKGIPAWPPPCLLLMVAATQAIRRWPHSKCGWVESSPRLQSRLSPCDHLISPRLEAMREVGKWQLEWGELPGSWSQGLQFWGALGLELQLVGTISLFSQPSKEKPKGLYCYSWREE